MIEVENAQDHGYRTWIRPDRSLTLKGCRLVFCGIAATALGVAAGLAWHGLWVPLPFAGGELVALGFCWMLTWRRGDQVDEIKVSEREVAVRQDRPGQGSRETFHPAWMRIELRAGAYAGYPHQLVLSSHGRELEVGAFLNEDERGCLASELGRQIERIRHRSRHPEGL